MSLRIYHYTARGQGDQINGGGGGGAAHIGRQRRMFDHHLLHGSQHGFAPALLCMNQHHLTTILLDSIS
ncbi:hypothetical protein [Paenibacillus tyrfis]|uniref:hypothetical protein n=1 Tax=Paenibacillus tyrfis TaxID=1501230 RepID=UPI0015C5DD07|nr:hypothetical protein [Paenibacillus tyrfis]